MDIQKFKEVENRFQQLKLLFDQKKLSAEELTQELKTMMVLDDKGHYWMVGGKSGKWYLHDGTDWKSGNPYPPDERATVHAQERSAVAPTESTFSGEVKLKREDDQVSCKYCQSRIPAYALYCSFCGGSQKRLFQSKSFDFKEGELLLKSIQIPSLIFFLGGIGVIFGVIIGATFGIFSIGGDMIFQFPAMLQETRGKVQGGLLFGALGGIAGFIAMSVLAVLLSLFHNAISYIFGGIRFKVKT